MKGRIRRIIKSPDPNKAGSFTHANVEVELEDGRVETVTLDSKEAGLTKAQRKALVKERLKERLQSGPTKPLEPVVEETNEEIVI